MSRIKHSPALVISILALVAAIAVPAYALTRDEKRVVRSIAKFQANKQITERAPGLSVKNAETTDEVVEDEVVSNRLVLKDPIAGDAPGHAWDLLNAGPISILATCYDDWGVGGQPGNDVADLHLQIFDVPGAYWSGIRFHGDTIDPIAGTVFANTGSTPFMSAVWPAASEPEGYATETVQVTFFADDGQVLTVSARAEVNIDPKDPEDPEGDREGCRFSASAVGLGS